MSSPTNPSPLSYGDAIFGPGLPVRSRVPGGLAMSPLGARWQSGWSGDYADQPLGRNVIMKPGWWCKTFRKLSHYAEFIHDSLPNPPASIYAPIADVNTLLDPDNGDFFHTNSQGDIRWGWGRNFNDFEFDLTPYYTSQPSPPFPPNTPYDYPLETWTPAGGFGNNGDVFCSYVYQEPAGQNIADDLWYYTWGGSASIVAATYSQFILVEATWDARAMYDLGLGPQYPPWWVMPYKDTSGFFSPPHDLINFYSTVEKIGEDDGYWGSTLMSGGKAHPYLIPLPELSDPGPLAGDTAPLIGKVRMMFFNISWLRFKADWPELNFIN